MKKGRYIKVGIWVMLFACTVLSASGCMESRQRIFSGTASPDVLMPEAVRVVNEGLADDNPLVRINAIEVVASTRQVKMMPKVQRLLNDKLVPVKFSTTLAVGDMEYRLAENAVRQLLNNENENVRIAAAYAMIKFGHSQSFELLYKGLKSKDQTVRANAVLLIGKSGDKNGNALKSLYWVLRDKDSDDKVRCQAAEAIATLGDEKVYPKLWTMLISVYADVRVMGIRSMGALKTPEAKNALITMLDDSILEVRLAAAEQLGALGDNAGERQVLDVFEKNLTADLDEDGLERVNVLTALAIGRIRTPALTKFLPQLLKSESKLVRIAAAKAVFQHELRD